MCVFKKRGSGGTKKAFELTETERGEPPFGTGWRDVRGKEAKKRPVPASVDEARDALSDDFNADINKDLIFREFTAMGEKRALIAYLNGMADDGKINEFILKPLLLHRAPEGTGPSLDHAAMNVIEIAELDREKDLGRAELGIMAGMTALFMDGEAECLLLETRGFEKRSIGAAENEKVVSGPKEGFTESFRTNVTMLRRQLHVTDLVVEIKNFEGGAGTCYALVFREGVTNRALVDEVRRRLAGIAFGGALSSGIVEQLVEDNGFSPLPQILSTERPDRACSHIMQGCVCLIMDGSPFALVMPVTLFSLLNSPEDVYMRMPLGTLIRLIRYFGAFVSIMLPGYFLSLALYHQGILSTEVLSTVIASRRMVFEPIGIEMLLLLIIFQMIREAGQRVPGNIGQAIGIIGGLIMGQAAVAAHLASSVVLIIVAASGLGNFCIPDYRTQLAASYFRIAVVLAAWLGGLLGTAAVTLLAVCHAASLRSFGVPFLSPAAPRTSSKRPPILRGRIGRHMRADDVLNTSDDAEL